MVLLHTKKASSVLYQKSSCFTNEAIVSEILEQVFEDILCQNRQCKNNVRFVPVSSTNRT